MCSCNTSSPSRSAADFAKRNCSRKFARAYAYRNLTDEEWQWCLDFVTRGGQRAEGVSAIFARAERRRRISPCPTHSSPELHRMSVGTITSDSAMAVRIVRGAMLGHD